MGIGLGILLIAAGAILTFAVHASVHGLNIHTVGVILMIVGALGLVMTMTLFMPRRRASVVHDRTTTTDPTYAGNAPYAGNTVARERVVERHDVY